MELEYKDFEEMPLIDKIWVFGWLSDLLTEEDPETIMKMHEDKIRRIKKCMVTP